MKKILFFLAMVLPLAIVGCKKDKTPSGPVAVTGVKITPAAVTLRPHEEQTFTVEIMPANATDKKVTWEYDGTLIEPVEGEENTFRVLFAHNNPTTLAVKTEDGGFTSEAEITITEPVMPTAIALSEPKAMKVGESQTLSFTITPAEACGCDEEVIWSYDPYVSADDPNCVIAMDEITGEIIAIRPGIATVTVETVLGGATDQVTITVSESFLTADSFATWAGGTIQLTPSGEVESYEVVAPEGRLLAKGKLECSQEGVVTLPLYMDATGVDYKDGLVRINAKLKSGEIESIFVLSKAWKPVLYTNTGLNEVATVFTAGKDVYLTVSDSSGDTLSYGEFMNFASVIYAEGSGVANSINKPMATNSYRQIQIRTGEYANYNVCVKNGEVSFDFDLTPNN